MEHLGIKVLSVAAVALVAFMWHRFRRTHDHNAEQPDEAQREPLLDSAAPPTTPPRAESPSPARPAQENEARIAVPSPAASLEGEEQAEGEAEADEERPAADSNIAAVAALSMPPAAPSAGEAQPEEGAKEEERPLPPAYDVYAAPPAFISQPLPPPAEIPQPEREELCEEPSLALASYDLTGEPVASPPSPPPQEQPQDEEAPSSFSLPPQVFDFDAVRLPIAATAERPASPNRMLRASPRSPFLPHIPPPTESPFLPAPAGDHHTAAAALAAADAAADDGAGYGPGGSYPPGAAQQPRMERSFTLHSTASDRRLPRVSEEDNDDDGVPRCSFDVDVRLALKLDVIAGPRLKTSFVSDSTATEVRIGRGPDNDLVIPDGEVSGKHCIMSWCTLERCWQIADLGSLNGTTLNGETIGGRGRDAGQRYRLCADDIVQLGTLTKMKVSVFPREMLPENSVERSLSLSLGPGSLPRSLTMPKHRIPSFSSLLTPKINSPSKHAVVAAASDELRLECCIASLTGRDHARRGQACEDVALAECPLHGSEAALAGSPAALFCVFDGHCGRGAAEAAAVALPDEVSDRLAEGAAALSTGEGASALFHEAFLSTDERIHAEEGCTATAILAWRGPAGEVNLQAANVGDSAALLIDPETGGWQVLTEDHRLTNPRERDRLARTGIPLAGGTRRLYGLNLARALGDRFLKDEDLGLSAEPSVSDVIAIPLHRGALLVVASDGLWDVLDPEKVAKLAAEADHEQDGSVVEIAAAVVAAAKKAGTRDDVTALVVRLWPDTDWSLRSPLQNLDDGQVASFEA